jgi:hypothetical protein
MTKSQKSVPVASIKSLAGATPEFNVPVTVQRREGDPAKIVIRAKALRKSEWATLRDERLKAEQAEKAKGSTEFSFSDLMASGSKGAAELICKAATSWDLEDDFTVENLMELEDLVPNAVGSILGAIDQALFQGRLGN